MNNTTTGVGSASADPAPGGDELVQALRNLWPILDKPSRRKAIDIADEIRKKTE